MLWHVPLWFVVGASQQNMNFVHYAIYGLILSVWLATIYKKTRCVFFCCVFHGLSNTLLSYLVIKVNRVLVSGLIISVIVALFLDYRKNTEIEKSI